jgi:hypothetical protein
MRPASQYQLAEYSQRKFISLKMDVEIMALGVFRNKCFV